MVWNPFKRQNDQLLRTQNILASALFNSNDKSGWNGNYRYTDNDNLVNANFSNEQHSQKSHFLNIGYFFTKAFRADWENTLQNVTNSSQIYVSRNYLLQNWETKPKATYKLTETLEFQYILTFSKLISQRK